MPVTHVTSDAQYQEIIKNAGDKLVVVDFFATWCGPCKRIAPFIEELSNKYTDVIFIKVDVDELQQTATREGVTAMPTFFFYKRGEKVADVVGASNAKVQELVEKHK